MPLKIIFTRTWLATDKASSRACYLLSLIGPFLIRFNGFMSQHYLNLPQPNVFLAHSKEESCGCLDPLPNEILKNHTTKLLLSINTNGCMLSLSFLEKNLLSFSTKRVRFSIGSVNPNPFGSHSNGIELKMIVLRRLLLAIDMPQYWVTVFLIGCVTVS